MQQTAQVPGSPEVGVDYLTCTLSRDAPHYQTWVRTCLQSLDHIADDGNERSLTRMQGYDGYLTAGCFFGENDVRGMLRLSSYWADRYFLATFREDAHYSRLDLQVTVIYVSEVKGVASAVYQAKNDAIHHDGRPARLKTRLVTDSDGGSTVYIGARTSAQFGRIYNKGAQSAEERYRNAWRYEVELHNESATKAAQLVRTLSMGYREWIARYVARWYGSRGVHAPWPITSGVASIPPSARPESDVQTKLGWLMTQVAPSVRWLCTQVDRSVILAVLGLSDAPGAGQVDGAEEGYDGAERVWY